MAEVSFPGFCPGMVCTVEGTGEPQGKVCSGLPNLSPERGAWKSCTKDDEIPASGVTEAGPAEEQSHGITELGKDLPGHGVHAVPTPQH